jgi:polysaccharide export outer membrane protein
MCKMAALSLVLLAEPVHAGQSLLASGKAAYDAVPAPAGDGSIPEYRIGPADALDITVFQESDISVKGAPVDASGDISMPLIGRVHAAGMTTVQFADVVAQKLGERYVNPQVTVSIASSVTQRITVQGQVTEPGISDARHHAAGCDRSGQGRNRKRRAAPWRWCGCRTASALAPSSI